MTFVCGYENGGYESWLHGWNVLIEKAMMLSCFGDQIFMV